MADHEDDDAEGARTILTTADIDGMADRVLRADQRTVREPAGRTVAPRVPPAWPRFRLPFGSSGEARQPRWGWVVLTWPILAGVVLGLLLRQRGTNRAELVALIGLAPALAAPLVVTALGAWRSRSTPLRVATALVTGSFLVAMNPVSAVAGCGGESASDSFTLYTANVLSGGGRPSEIADSILANGADVITLQEVDGGILQGLRDDPRLAEAYPYRSDDLAEWATGRIIWSRWPLTDVTIDNFVVSHLVSATVESPYGPFRVTSVHTLSPTDNGKVGPWMAQFDQLSQVPTDTPRIMAGDYNATADHRPFRELLDSGWTDAHEPKGCGYDATWPVDPRVPVPFYRLDHVLVTDDFEVLDVGLGDPAGSDHLPVVAEIRLAGPELRSRSLGPIQA